MEGIFHFDINCAATSAEPPHANAAQNSQF
jgi:hypothetical protein